MIFQHQIQMENKETDKIVVSKPVASRPSSTIIRPFSNLVTGAIRGSSPNVGPEMGSGPIKPKSLRFKPTVNHVPTPVVSSQGDAPKSDIKPTTLYKPLAKVVSKTAASVLANMGNFEPGDRQAKPSPRPCSSGVQLSSNSHENSRDLATTASGDCCSSLPVEGSRDMPYRPSYDGYNWRKYGQKQVKGSEYPRSYYKCTHPNCQVKKKVERSLDGQIAEIVYKGEHNHPKPRPPKQGLGTVQMTEPLTSGRAIERKEGSESKGEATNGINLKGSLANDCAVDRGLPSARLNLDSHSAEHKDGTTRMGMDPDEPRSKRRKTKNQQDGLEVNGESPREPQVSVQGSVDPEILDDGFRWRKYGQKVVKGNPSPRNYYKCTGFECNVRKHVERSLDDPAVFITTYEGKHNHEMPPRSMNTPSSDSTVRTTASKDRMPV